MFSTVQFISFRIILRFLCMFSLVFMSNAAFSAVSLHTAPTIISDLFNAQPNKVFTFKAMDPGFKYQYET